MIRLVGKPPAAPKAPAGPPLPPVNALYRALNEQPKRSTVVLYLQVGRVGVYWPTKPPAARS